MTAFPTLVYQHPALSLLIYSIVMLLIGSVLAMIIYRLPHMIDPSHFEAAQSFSQFNLFLPRSHCVYCKKIIPLYHNIPVLSYVFLRGHCHACQHPISWRYPLIEILTLILSWLALYLFGYQWTLLAALAFLWIGLCLTMIDLEHQILPDALNYILLWLGLLVNSQAIFCTLSAAVWGAVIAYLVLWIVIKLFYLLTGKIGMGHGDFKLFAALGAWFGWTALTPILLIACTLGIILGTLYLKLHKKNLQQPIPFGPYLCIAGMIYLCHPLSFAIQ